MFDSAYVGPWTIFISTRCYWRYSTVQSQHSNLVFPIYPKLNFTQRYSVGLHAADRVQQLYQHMAMLPQAL